MDEKELKYVCGTTIIVVVASLQGYAWHCGINGTVFAFTSLIIGGIAGTLLGFSVKKPG